MWASKMSDPWYLKLNPIFLQVFVGFGVAVRVGLSMGLACPELGLSKSSPKFGQV